MVVTDLSKRVRNFIFQSKHIGQLQFHFRKPMVLCPLRSLRKERSGLCTIGLRRCPNVRETVKTLKHLVDNTLALYSGFPSSITGTSTLSDEIISRDTVSI